MKVFHKILIFLKDGFPYSQAVIVIVAEMSWCGGGLVVDNPEGEKMRRVEERMEEVEN